MAITNELLWLFGKTNFVFDIKKTDINDRRDPLRCPRDTLYPQKLALILPTSGGRSVGIVRMRTKCLGV
jgi:hypothetical protein